jgi:hypothetical protein
VIIVSLCLCGCVGLRGDQQGRTPSASGLLSSDGCFRSVWDWSVCDGDVQVERGPCNMDRIMLHGYNQVHIQYDDMSSIHFM